MISVLLPKLLVICLSMGSMLEFQKGSVALGLIGLASALGIQIFMI